MQLHKDYLVVSSSLYLCLPLQFYTVCSVFCSDCVPTRRDETL